MQRCLYLLCGKEGKSIYWMIVCQESQVSSVKGGDGGVGGADGGVGGADQEVVDRDGYECSRRIAG